MGQMRPSRKRRNIQNGRKNFQIIYLISNMPRTYKKYLSIINQILIDANQ